MFKGLPKWLKDSAVRFELRQSKKPELPLGKHVLIVKTDYQGNTHGEMNAATFLPMAIIESMAAPVLGDSWQDNLPGKHPIKILTALTPPDRVPFALDIHAFVEKLQEIKAVSP